MKKRFFLYLFSICIILSCQDSSLKKELSNSSDIIEVFLKKEAISEIFARTNKPFRFVKKKEVNIKGIPKLDTFLLQYFITTRKKKLLDLYNSGHIDSLKYPIKKFKNGNYGINGYLGDKQIIIIDANNNLDFSDDPIISFNKNLKYKTQKDFKVRDSFPIINLKYDFFDGTKIIDRKTTIRPLAYLNSYPKKEDQLKNELSIFGEIRESFNGEFNLSNKNYKIAVNEQSLFGIEILIKPSDKEFVKRSDPTYFAYRIKDTVHLSNTYYRIDSINPAISKLFLKDLKIDSKQYGYRKGERVQNFNFKSLDGKEYNLSSLVRSKKYLLIDFWGTWCAPCKELTPDLVAMNAKYGDDLNLLSVAYDKRKEPVEQYVKDHKMNWNHHFLEGNAKRRKNTPSLITDLKIEGYPTFILIDKKLNILYRGYGKKALKDIRQIIKIEEIKINP